MEKKKVGKKVLKIIAIILIVIFVLFMVNTIRKLVIIKNIQKKASQYTSSTNYHIKSVASGMNDDYITIMECYCKGDKQVSTIERCKDGKVINKISTYNNGTRKDTFYETEEVKRVDKNSDFEVYVSIYDYFEGASNMQLICETIASKVEDIEYNGKKCYRIANCYAPSTLYDNKNISEVYIEKNTGLVIRTHFGDSISEREYEFGNVQDEVFIEPDLKEYEVMKK